MATKKKKTSKKKATRKMTGEKGKRVKLATLPKNIVSVVFDFNLERLEATPGAVEYTYFFRGKVKVGDVAMVNSPHGGLKGVLVTTTEPSATAIRKATKSLIGVVDLEAYRAECALWATDALEEAWEENYRGTH